MPEWYAFFILPAG